MKGYTTLAVVVVLGALAILICGGGIYLAAHDKTLPDALVALAGGAVTGLVGILVPKPERPEG